MSDSHTRAFALRNDIVLSLVFFHLGCIAAPFAFSVSGLVVALILWWLTGGLGICMGFHRLFTHGSFRTYKPMRYVLLVLGCLANEGPPIIWVGTHRLHHLHADQADDPHSPKEDFSWGHVVWAFFFEHERAREAAKDLQRDPFFRWIDRWFFVPNIVLGIALYAANGWSWVVWGIFVRTVVVLHCTWFVNSAAHRWGYQNFDTGDESRNNWWVSILTFGEGWHNNHHADQRSAAHGMRWWEIDVTYLSIRALEAAGLAWDVKSPKASVA